VTEYPSTEQTFAVVPAAGSGVRMGLPHPKQFHPLHGKPILVWTMERLISLPFLDGVIAVVPEAAVDTMRLLLTNMTGKPPIFVVAGGSRRQDSVLAGIEALPQTCHWVLIHDGVRPFASRDLFQRTYEAARRNGAAVCACRAVETVKIAHDGWIHRTLPRDQVWLVQTPQVFRRDLLVDAFREAQTHGWEATDDASLVERLGVRVAIVEGEKANIKITTQDDLDWATWILERAHNTPSTTCFGKDEAWN